MDIFEEIEKAGLPKGEFVVMGSGILAALGIREAEDIDLLVKPELFEQLKSNGWKYEVVEIGGIQREKLSKGTAEAFKDFWWKGNILDADTGFAWAEDRDGVKFVPLNVLLEAKKDMGREKDIQDVALIEAYTEAHK